jgi:polysaccharide pyruvyl transferase WcaK-like protein
MLPFEKSDDGPILQSLARACEQLGLKTYLLNPDDLTTPSQWLALMPKLDMLVGMRFHALLMALKAGRPVVGLPYDPKVSYLCNAFEQPLLNCQAMNGRFQSHWLETLQAAFDKRLELADRAKNAALLMQEKSCMNFQVLARILKS